MRHFGFSAPELSGLYVSLALTGTLVLRMALARLHWVYPLLFWYLALDLGESVNFALAIFYNRGTYYGYSYLVGQALKMILAVFVVREIYQLALENHPAIAAFGRKTVSYVLSASAAVAVCGILLESGASTQGKSTILVNFFTIERTVDTALLVFLIVITAFMFWFPVRLKRNVTFYVAGFVAYFFGRAAGLLMVNLFPASYRSGVSAGTVCITIGCLLVWLFALTGEGETSTTVVGHLWNRDSAERLLLQLDAINRNLSRLGRS